MIRTTIRLCFGLLLCLGQSAFAGSGLLFNVITNANQLVITTASTSQYYPRAGIKINTPGYSLTDVDSGCTFNGKGYCVFGVDSLDQATITVNGHGGILDITLCLNADGPVSCQRFRNIDLQVAYITSNFNFNTDGSVSVCPIFVDGTTGNGTQCVGANADIPPPFINPLSSPNAIVLNPSNSVAYMINQLGQNITVCPIASSGAFAECLQTFTFNTSNGGAAISPDGRFLYVTNYENSAPSLHCLTTGGCGTVEKCTLNSGDGTIQSCADSGAGDTPFENPVGVTLNKAGTLAYVTNDANYVEICSVDKNGDFNSCHNAIETTKNIDIAFSGPKQIVLNKAETFAYVTNRDVGLVFKCTLSNNGQNFSSCADSGGKDIVTVGFGENVLWGMALNEIKAKAYITNTGAQSIWICEINENGDLGNCNPYEDQTFNGTSAIALT